MSTGPPSSDRSNVFKVRYGPVLADPDIPGTRYHTVIFVETNSDGSGYIHHVTGDLVTGMRYEFKTAPRPEISRTFHDKEHIGTILRSLHPNSMAEVCRAIPAPPRQKAFNVKTKRTEPVKPDGSFYEPGEARPALMKCTEWTETRAIPALIRQQVIVPINQNGHSALATGPADSSAPPGGNDWTWVSQYRRYGRWEGSVWRWADA